MASDVDVCNLSLGWLGKKPILSLDDPQTEAVLCKQNYPVSRDAVLSDAEWTFSIKRFQLPQDAEVPAYGYGVKYLVPEEVIRLLNVNDEQLEQGQTSGGDWQLEGPYIVTNAGQANVRAITRVTDPDLFSPEFVRCVAARLASDMCMALTNSKGREETLEKKYYTYLGRAKAQDGRQGTSKRLMSNWLRRARA